jgi:flavin reductase (DIM6/NTAB) family NADH-FMN oxidoreductase RutF
MGGKADLPVKERNVDQKDFRSVMGHLPAGVTVVTTRAEDGSAAGLTVSAFTSVSLRPTLVLVCIHKNADSHDHILRRRAFAVNILAADQEALALRFSVEPPESRFLNLDPQDSPLGNPLISGSVGWLDCRVTDAFPGGDHSVILAEAVDGRAREGDPLLFHRGILKGIGA